MIRKRIAAALVALATALVAVLGFAAPALAVEYDGAVDATWNNDHYKHCMNTTFVEACVQPEGDVLWVKDNVENGKAVGILWFEVGGSRSGECIDELGVAKGWTVCNKDFPEGSTIRWQVGWELAGDTWDWSNPTTTKV